jgi:multidrug resistance efflux pump
MLPTFPETLRALEADRPERLTWAWVPAAALLGGWLAWALAAPVSVTVESGAARFEGTAAPLALRAPLSGRIAVCRLALGRLVVPGEALVVLDAGDLLARRAAVAARRDALAAEAEGRRAEEAETRRALAEEQRAQAAAAAEREQRAGEEASAARLAAQVGERQARLAAAGVVAAAEAARVRAEADQRRLAAGAAALAAEAGRRADLAGLADRRAALGRLAAEEARLRAEAAGAAADAAALDRQIARRTLRAPAAGMVSRTWPVAVGAEVASGTVLALLIPDAPLKVTARFSASALGVIRAGQRAWVYVAGGPATQAAVLVAQVSAVVPGLVPDPALEASTAGLTTTTTPATTVTTATTATTAGSNDAADERSGSSGGTAPSLGSASPSGASGADVELTLVDRGQPWPDRAPGQLGQSCEVEVEIARTTPAAWALRALLGDGAAGDAASNASARRPH